MAGGFGAVVYLLVKYLVLARRNPFPYALASGPIVFFTAAGTFCLPGLLRNAVVHILTVTPVTAVMTLAIVYKVC